MFLNSKLYISAFIIFVWYVIINTIPTNQLINHAGHLSVFFLLITSTDMKNVSIKAYF